MPEPHHPSGEDDPATSIDGLPLCLTFDLGERETTLGQLRQLQVGQVIDLGQPLGEPVRLRVHGVLVAQGSLVEIDGRLGVTIVALHGNRQAAARARAELAASDTRGEGDEDIPHRRDEGPSDRDQGDPEHGDMEPADELPTDA